jgi:hypothetical protein
MALRTVRLRPEAEKALKRIMERTGCSVSAALNDGVLVLRERLAEYQAASAWDVYRTLDLGSGGYAVAPSSRAREGVRQAIKRKLERSD